MSEKKCKAETRHEMDPAAGSCLVVRCREHGIIGKIPLCSGLDFLQQDSKFIAMWQTHRIDAEKKSILEWLEAAQKLLAKVPEQKPELPLPLRMTKSYSRKF